MASIITLDGVGNALGVTNDYGEEITPATPSLWGDAAQTFVGWGIVAFAVGTGIFRLKHALGSFGHRRQYHPTREDIQGFFGRRGRRRRRR